MPDPSILEIQKQLNAQGYRDPNGNPLEEDGIMGPRTMTAMSESYGTQQTPITSDPQSLEAWRGMYESYASPTSGYGSNMQHGMDWGPYLQPIGSKPTQTPSGQTTYVKPATPTQTPAPSSPEYVPIDWSSQGDITTPPSWVYNQPKTTYAPGGTGTPTTPAGPSTPAGYDPEKIAAIVRQVEAQNAARAGSSVGGLAMHTPGFTMGIPITAPTPFIPQVTSLAGYAQTPAYQPPAYDYGSLLNRLWARINQPTDYTANLEQNPLYISEKKRLKKRAEEASSQAVQRMSARNLAKSSITRDLLAKIQQGTEEELEFGVVPRILSQLQAQERSQIEDIYRATGLELGAGQSEAARQMQLAQMQQQQGQFNAQQLLAWAQYGTQQQQFQAQQELARMGLGQKEQQFMLEQELARQKLAQEQYQFGMTYEQKEADRALRERLGIGSLQLQQAAQKLSAARLAQSTSHDEYLRQRDLTEQQAQRATQGYLSQILNVATAEDAFAYIVNNADNMVNDGADISKILSSFRTRYPEFYRNNQLDALLQGLLK